MKYSIRFFCRAVAGSLLFATCTPHVHPQLVVIVDSNLNPRVDYDRVHFEVQGPDGTVQYEDTRVLDAVGDAALSVPFSFGVYPANGDATRPVTVTAEALFGSTHVVSYKAITAYESDRVLELDLFLERACVGVEATCAQRGQECGRGGTCVSVAVSPTTLTVYRQDAGFDAARPVEAGLDASTDVAIDADAGSPDSGVDVPVSDVGHDVGGPRTFLLLGATGNSANAPFGSAFTAGHWAPMTALTGTDCFAPGGGGVTVLPDGRGIAVVRANSSGIVQSAAWSAGHWGTMSSTGAGASSYTSGPVTTPTGALYVRQSGSGPSALAVDSFDDTTSRWSTGSALAFLGDNQTLPVVALTGTGQAIVADVARAGGYSWSLRAGTSWSAPAAFSGPTLPSGPLMPQPFVALALRAGVDDLVAVFGSGTSSLVAQHRLASGWTGNATIAADVQMGPGFSAPVSLASLPDGRIAAAYATSTTLKVGFFDGTGWSPFTAVPGVPPVPAQAAPFGLAPGADASAGLELVYIENTTRHLRHTRLTNESGWTWSAPALVEGTQSWESVWIGVGP